MVSYEPILSQTIVASVDNALAANTPGFLESIRMTTFTRERSPLSYTTTANLCSRYKGCVPDMPCCDSILTLSASDRLHSYISEDVGTPQRHAVMQCADPGRPEDVVIMDWALSFTPSDVMDITKRQALAQVNPKIVLSIRVGKGVVSKALPILLEDINFTGKMR